MIDSKRMLARTGTTWRINHGVLKLSLPSVTTRGCEAACLIGVVTSP